MFCLGNTTDSYPQQPHCNSHYHLQPFQFVLTGLFRARIRLTCIGGILDSFVHWSFEVASGRAVQGQGQGIQFFLPFFLFFAVGLFLSCFFLFVFSFGLILALLILLRMVCHAPQMKKTNLADAVSCSVCPSGEVPRHFPGQMCANTLFRSGVLSPLCCKH